MGYLRRQTPTSAMWAKAEVDWETWHESVNGKKIHEAVGIEGIGIVPVTEIEIETGIGIGTGIEIEIVIEIVIVTEIAIVEEDLVPDPGIVTDIADAINIALDPETVDVLALVLKIEGKIPDD